MTFKAAKLDKISLTVTILVSAFLIILSLFFLIKVPFGWAFAIMMMLILLIAYLLSPKQYYFEGPNLVIEKVIGKRIIVPLKKIEGYTIIPNFMKLKVARTFGNGGLFGYYGLFSSAEFGNINCQLTKLKNILLIKTDKGNYAVSPAENERFEQELKARMSNFSAEAKTIKPIPPEKRKLASPLILLIPIILFLIIVFLIILNYSQLPDRIAVHFDAHGAPDRWGPKSSYLFSGLIPTSILLALTIGVFFFVRRTTNNPAMPNFLVIIISYIQLFLAYTSFDTFWVNKYETHLISIPAALLIFVVGILILLLVYYLKIVRKSSG